MSEKLLPITVMLYPHEIEKLEKIKEEQSRSKSSILRLAFLEYAKGDK